MKLPRLVAFATATILLSAPSVWAQLTKVDIFPTNAPPTAPGTYTTGAGGTFTITSDGRPFFPPSVTDANAGDVGDGLTFPYETVTNDFDKRVKITGISASDPADTWTRGALQARTTTNSYSTSLQIVAANPQGANQVGFTGRGLDGQNYTWWGRNLSGVTNALPNQWLRLRRVGNQFTAYVGTNGTTWSLIAQRYQVLPAVLCVGPYAASGAVGTIATVNFASYGDTPSTDAIAPALVSAGTLDKKVVGVRFSEPVSSTTATVLANYQVTQTGGGAVTISSIKMGISGDAVHLAVTGLTNDNFIVKVIGGVKDTAGNTISPNTQVAARALNWNHGDIGLIQNTNSRPTVGDDPGTVGQAVMISSDDNPEIEIIGGGSNQWNPGDFIHYVWRTQPLSGNFDVTAQVSRYDRPANTAGWGNAGIMLRAAIYLPGNDPTTGLPYAYTKNGTKVKHVVNSTYIEASAPGRGSIPLWRTADLGGYGNGNAGFSWQTVIGGVKGYYSDLRALDASGTIDPQSSSDTARYLRIKRVGTHYTFYASWNRTDWALVDQADLPDLPDQLLLGFSVMGDTGGGDPPFGGYGGNGHQLDPLDPYNPVNAGGVVQNDSNYEVMRIKVFPNGVTDPLPATLTKVDIRPVDEPVPSPSLPGSWTSTGTLSFDMTGGGTAPFRNLSAPYDGSLGGDELTFAYEAITGDFDKQVNITSLTNRLYNNDGSAYDYVSVPPVVDQWTRAGLMVRNDPTNAYAQCLKLLAANPEGANLVRVMGRGIDAQNYTLYSSDYPGVTNALPNQYLRMQRVGNSFSFYVSKNGTAWSLIGQTYQEMPATVFFGPYCAAGLNPTDATGNPNGLLSVALATFTAYDDLANNPTGDLTGPVLISAGTLDKKTVGVKFNEKVSSATATVPGNYSLSQGTVTAAKVGIGGDSVYLTVSGLTANTFTVTVTNVADTLGNKIAANSTVNAKVTALTSTDIGFFRGTNTTPRTPTPGDDPYRIGQAVATSSDDAAEVEIIGGGSNAWNPGDFVHWLYSPTPIPGNFDVAVKVSRNDRPNNTAGWANSGVMLRAGVYVPGLENTPEGTKVPMVANTTYIENSAPARAAIPLWRAEVGANYGNGTPVGWTTLVGGIKGYYTGLRATNASGTLDPESSPFSARWLRIQRTGADFTFSWGYNGLQWELESVNTPGFTNSTFLFGYSTMNDTGGGAPPFGGYAADGHTINPLDPLNYLVAGGNIQNESNYSIQRVRLYSSSAAIGAIHVALVGVGEQVSVTFSGTLVSSPDLTGPWTVVPKQSSPYVVTPATGSRLYYRVLP